jgi:hypothetical protein
MPSFGYLKEQRRNLVTDGRTNFTNHHIIYAVLWYEIAKID